MENIKQWCYLIIIITVLIVIATYFIENKRLKKSSYGKQKNVSLFKIVYDTGDRGEYRTSIELDKTSFYNRQIFNCYIPKKNNETTEIDIIMLSTKGIFVIENKNYDGWIFGNEKSKNWCQTLHGKKNFFYNPIQQNKSHITHLAKFIGKESKDIFSIITFNKAVLKKIEYEKSENLKVINTNKLRLILKECGKNEDMYSKEEVETIYNLLIPCTKISKQEKQNHINRIKTKSK